MAETAIAAERSRTRRSLPQAPSVWSVTGRSAVGGMERSQAAPERLARHKAIYRQRELRFDASRDRGCDALEDLGLAQHLACLRHQHPPSVSETRQALGAVEERHLL